MAVAVVGPTRHCLSLQSQPQTRSRLLSGRRRIHTGPSVWRSEDHYLDIEVRTGGGAELADVDELLDAVRHGLLTPTVAEQAVRHAVDAVEGLARNGYDLTRWLATKGMELTWRSGS